MLLNQMFKLVISYPSHGHCFHFSNFNFPYIGSVELASAGVSLSLFNIISKLFNIPLLSVATSFVAEDVSKNARRLSAAGRANLNL